ncbi:hypothetical protein BDZ91DRAFT_190503 [Kalaharituber pfeilii]|nr:hypothetical protein BDZ91DRAFT_190503 [Kalaharituber pfeilii]
MKFTAVTVLLASLASSVIASPVPSMPRSLPLGARDHQFMDSKKVPVLKSGNALITSYFNVVYRQDTPNKPFTPEEKEKQGNDTNRGFANITPNNEGRLMTTGTLQVFDVPDVAEGKQCRFHFFMGAGDGASGFVRLQLFSLVPPGEVGEFTTTFNNRPARDQHLGTFAHYAPEWLEDEHPYPDVVADVPNNWNDPSLIEWGVGGLETKFCCPALLGKWHMI